jgi:hypothetical protein
VERTVALFIRLPGGGGRLQGAYAEDEVEPLTHEPAELAEILRAFAREGISHVQLVLDPITLASIEALAPVLGELDGAP